MAFLLFSSDHEKVRAAVREKGFPTYRYPVELFKGDSVKGRRCNGGREIADFVRF